MIYSQSKENKNNLKGTVAVQNRKEFVKDATVEEPQKGKSTQSDDEGNFSMYLDGFEYEDDISLKVQLPAKYKNYVVVGVDPYGFVKTILYRTKPVNIFIRNYSELVAERKKSLDNNIKNNLAYKNLEKLIQQLKHELKQKNENYELLNDSLLLAKQKISDLEKMIETDVDRLIRKNLTSLDETKPAEARLKKVYEYKLRGDLIGAMENMSDAEELLHKAIEQKIESEELQEYINLVMEKARTFKLLNNHKEAKRSYEQCINAAPSNYENMLEFIYYLSYIREYGDADNYLKLLKSRYDKLIKENPQRYLHRYANILNAIGMNYHLQYNDIETERYFKNSLIIYKQMENENIQFNLYDYALVLNNSGLFYLRKADHSKADYFLQSSLKICRQLKKENSETYSLLLALVLNNLGLNYWQQYRKDIQNIEQSEIYYTESYEILGRLVKNDPLVLSTLSLVLGNLGLLYAAKDNNTQADTLLQRSLEICIQLAKDNPDLYNNSLALIKFNIGDRCYSKGNIEQAIALWTGAEEIGDAVIWNNLGSYYKEGFIKVENRLEKAFDLFSKAAEKNLAIAQYNLGLCFYQGEGVIQDYEKALYWYRKAAEQGDRDAQSSLGHCYLNGYIIKFDLEKGLYWCRKAAEQGEVQSQTFLGLYYHEIKNNTQAEYWLLKAAKQDYAQAQYNLGVIFYDEAKKMTRNYQKAFYWLIKASDQGYEESKEKLTGYLKKGDKNMIKDYETAQKKLLDEIE
jgi:TPR repeat protein